MKIIGHRGWRGSYPENSLLGFKELANLGVQAVELDIIITKDQEILVSHEPWFDPSYCSAATKNNLYRIDSNQIAEIDCGSKLYDRFPGQLKTKTVKPLFKDLIKLWGSLDVKPFLALEVKSESRFYGSYQPFPRDFAQLLIEFEAKYLNGFDYFVQSFDPYFLKTYHSLQPNTSTGLSALKKWRKTSLCRQWTEKKSKGVCPGGACRT